jgi:hypothetical protein
LEEYNKLALFFYINGCYTLLGYDHGPRDGKSGRKKIQKKFQNKNCPLNSNWLKFPSTGFNRVLKTGRE